MCGRYTQTQQVDTIVKAFHLNSFPDLQRRYNIAPGQMVPCIRLNESSQWREGIMLKWGFVPSWAKNPAIGHKMINARAETAASKPAFHSAFRKRRCLLIADGFYEWRKEGKGKQPYYFFLPDHQPFAFAGLWERWQANGKDPIESCAILTTEAAGVLFEYHHRMPVIVTPSKYEECLDPNTTERNLHALLEPYRDEIDVVPVSLAVNDPRNDDSRSVQPLTMSC